MPEKLSERQLREIEHIGSMAFLDVMRNIAVSRDEVSSFLNDLNRRHEFHQSFRTAVKDLLLKQIKTDAKP